MERDNECEFVLLGPGDVVINITNNNLDCLPDLNTYLCSDDGSSGEVGEGKRKSPAEVNMVEKPAGPPIFRAKRGRPCSEPPTREVVTKRRKVY